MWDSVEMGHVSGLVSGSRGGSRVIYLGRFPPIGAARTLLREL